MPVLQHICCCTVSSMSVKSRKSKRIRAQLVRQCACRLDLSLITVDQAKDTISRLLRRLNLSSSPTGLEKWLWKTNQENLEFLMPESFENLMEDFVLAILPTSANSASIRPRLDAICLQLLAVTRKNQRKAVIETPYWRSNSTITSPVDPVLKTSVDYILWYGPREEWSTQLVIIRRDRLIHDESWAALPAMAIIQDARKARGYESGVYGVCTDSYTWTFLHLTHHGQEISPRQGTREK
ncbi:hypothetical protein FE257_012840 [Aspergillus nanangensis]|uniref:Uncharacterized protein n=1 Tax=Aspergillus nanangensis TaxID=2582783 RepID=A0AAD4CGS7_ASPNN|nr:hypothetical protein FE257_012840 [Aspergillus nanangensis]